MADDQPADFFCSRCNSAALEGDTFCKNCGSVLVDSLLCYQHSTTAAVGVCLICLKPCCEKCGGDSKFVFLCDPHWGKYEIFEGMARVFVSSNPAQAQYMTACLTEAGLHPTEGLEMLVPCSEVLEAEKAIGELQAEWNQPGVEIRKVTLDDLTQLQNIGRTTFFETFASKNTEDNMQRYAEENFSDEKLTAELTNPDSEFYFATVGGSVVGYLKLNFRQAQTELQDDKAVEIERIYVLRTFHGKHVGQELYDKALYIAKQAQSNYVWLGVWEANPRAIRFYKKNGFVEFDTHMFTLGDDEQRDIMMKLEL